MQTMNSTGPRSAAVMASGVIAILGSLVTAIGILIGMMGLLLSSRYPNPMDSMPGLRATTAAIMGIFLRRYDLGSLQRRWVDPAAQLGARFRAGLVGDCGADLRTRDFVRRVPSDAAITESHGDADADPRVHGPLLRGTAGDCGLVADSVHTAEGCGPVQAVGDGGGPRRSVRCDSHDDGSGWLSCPCGLRGAAAAAWSEHSTPDHRAFVLFSFEFAERVFHFLYAHAV